ncbi:MAG TPA: NAD(P)-dependent oxidoreductase [Polyangiaceae bacterium]|jgi:nucleoside-diphosphate-sugar epimerase|nr:NAD(P)-dependent oxidoreductase [Polyangiaceae bacterium]
MRVLITGASGFLGSHVAEELVRDGAQVRCLVRHTSKVDFLQTLPAVELCYGAVEQRETLDDAVRGCDAVVHAAGLVKAKNADEFFDINVRGTEHLLDAVRQHAAPGFKRFVLVSSLAAVGPSYDGKPVDPEATSPVTHYGRSKRQAEDAVRAARDVPSVILRPPMIYGPRDNESFAFFKTVSRGMLPKLGDGTNTMSVIYASDAARACIRAISADVPPGSAYFIDDGRIYVWRDMLDDLERALGKKAIVRFGVPFPMLRLAATASEAMGKLTGKAVMLTRDKVNELSAPHWVCDSRDAQAALRWQPEIDWAEGTRRAAAWYRAEGWL